MSHFADILPDLKFETFNFFALQSLTLVFWFQWHKQLEGLSVQIVSNDSLVGCQLLPPVVSALNAPIDGENNVLGLAMAGFERWIIVCGTVGSSLLLTMPAINTSISSISGNQVMVSLCVQPITASTSQIPPDAELWLQLS